MTIGRVAHAGNDKAAFRQRRGHAEFVVIAVQIVDVLRDSLALEILPWAVADTITCVDRRPAVCGLRAQIGTPCLAAGPVPLGQLLAMLVRTVQSAQVRAL